MNKINKFQKIIPIKNSDLIIDRIKQLIRNGKLKPGEKLLSEIKLVEQLGVKLGDVRKALRKLEFYGILETKPQSGTFIANIEAKPLEILISNIQVFENFSEDEILESLWDTRIILEMRSAELAALRIDKNSLSSIIETQNIYIQNFPKKIYNDIHFHLKIVEASKSPILRYLITLICPKIISSIYSVEEKMKEDILIMKYKQTLIDHQKIIKALEEKNSKKASNAMKEHLKNAPNIY